MPIDPQILLVILGMAVATYAARAGGLWLARRLPTTERLEAWLHHIPGAVLSALIAPTLFSGSIAEAAAAGATVLAAARTGNLLLAIGIGVMVVCGVRLLMPS